MPKSKLVVVVVSAFLGLTGKVLAEKAECDKACPKTLIYVCGSDGTSYTNLCALENAHCDDKSVTYMYDGMCVSAGQTRDGVGASCTTCKDDPQPVCGSDGITYGSECILDYFICMGGTPSDVHVAQQGACAEQISRQCSNALCPSGPTVCGWDGVSTPRPFDSMCAMRKYVCSTGTAYVGIPDNECLLPSEPSSGEDTDCNIVCTASDEPVCGSDGRTYSGECQLQIEACRRPQQSLIIVSQGECASKESGLGLFAIIGIALGAVVLVAAAAVGGLVWRRKLVRDRQFKLFQSFEDALDESDSENSLDVQGIHLTASSVTMEDSFGKNSSKGAL